MQGYSYLDPKWLQANFRSPVSTEGPTPDEIRCNEALLQALEQSNVIESDVGRRQREVLLMHIQQMLVAFVRDEYVLAGHTDGASFIDARLFTYGSYKLGVHLPGGDLDTTAVVPRHVSRDAFFSRFYAKLEAQSGIVNLRRVVSAKSPVISFTYEEIEFDIGLCRIDLETIPESFNILDDSTLGRLCAEDPEELAKNVKAISGARDAHAVLKFVQDRGADAATYRTALRGIKRWGGHRLCTGFQFGYLNGVSLAILTALITTLYPRKPAARVIQKFFYIFGMKWAFTSHPVVLMDLDPFRDDGLSLFSWPAGDRPSVVARIITPAYPYQNASITATPMTFWYIKSELKRASKLIDTITTDSESSSVETPALTTSWLDAFAPMAFFTSYSAYIRIRIVCPAVLEKEYSGKFRQMLPRLPERIGAELGNPADDGSSGCLAVLLPKDIRGVVCTAPETAPATKQVDMDGADLGAGAKSPTDIGMEVSPTGTAPESPIPPSDAPVPPPNTSVAKAEVEGTLIQCKPEPDGPAAAYSAAQPQSPTPPPLPSELKWPSEPKSVVGPLAPSMRDKDSELASELLMNMTAPGTPLPVVAVPHTHAAAAPGSTPAVAPTVNTHSNSIGPLTNISAPVENPDELVYVEWYVGLQWLGAQPTAAANISRPVTWFTDLAAERFGPSLSAELQGAVLPKITIIKRTDIPKDLYLEGDKLELERKQEARRARRRALALEDGPKKKKKEK